MKRMSLLLALLVIASPARAEAPRVLSTTTGSKITYTLIHKMHTVMGEAKKGIEGKAALGPSGAQVMVRVPVASFDSGNANRDEHMKESVDAARYPMVELKAVGDGTPLM